MSGIDDEDGVEPASSFSSRKNARNIFIPRPANIVPRNITNYCCIGFGLSSKISRGGSRKLFREGHIRQFRLELSRRIWRSETLSGEYLGRGFTPPQPTKGFGSVVSSPSRFWAELHPLMIFGRYIRNFVRFHACFRAFWNLIGIKANKTLGIVSC